MTLTNHNLKAVDALEHKLSVLTEIEVAYDSVISLMEEAMPKQLCDVYDDSGQLIGSTTTDNQPEPNHTCWLTVDCIKCNKVVTDILLEDFVAREWERMHWQFGLFGQPHDGLIIESPRSAYIAGICPKCPK